MPQDANRIWRVVQWATGNVGSRALRMVIEHPRMELVGLWVSSANKVGKDAGELCGLAETGIRGRIGQWAQDRAFDPAQDQAALTARAIDTLQREVERYSCAGDPLLAAWPALVGPSTATDDLWRAATQLAREHGAGVTAHMSPDPQDPAFYLATTGRRPIAHLAAIDALGDHLSLTHAIFLDQEEVGLLAASGTHVTHCPMTAMKGAYGASHSGLFPEMAAAGVRIQLGTDGNNNGNAADLMRAMFVTAGLFKDARRDFFIIKFFDFIQQQTGIFTPGRNLYY